MNDSLQSIHYIGATLFALAILHTFSTKWFGHLAHRYPKHAGLWHLLGEVEAVFGFWALILMVFMVFVTGPHSPVSYLESQNFTEPLFVFVILVIAGSRPILYFAGRLVDGLVRIVPLPQSVAGYFVSLSVVPLLGSFITEPAAITLAALMLRDRFFAYGISERLKYVTLGVLLVNISIGGVLTPYAAPPVLMVAGKWGWDIGFMASVFGWKAATAVFVNALGAALLFRRELTGLKSSASASEVAAVPATVVFMHLLFLVGTVLASHHAVVFLGLFLFFLGYTQAYNQYQEKLMLREGLMVAFFLAGLVVLGGQQKWWLEPLLSGMNATTLYFGATFLTTFTDNAALTYLGSLVEGMSDTAKYALVAGAVTGGGMTVIANAPNPAAFAILKDKFKEQSISPLGLALAATLPTVVAILCFQLL